MYHGTHSGNYISLNNGINVSLSNRKLDFGPGFYLTSDFEQASTHAKNKAKIGGVIPIVFVYNIDIDKLREEYNGYVMDKLNELWAEFIYDNRSNKYYRAHTYDYAYGGVADGNLFDLIVEIDKTKRPSAPVDLRGFLDNIAKYHYDQLSLSNQDIVTNGIINFVKVVYADDEKCEYIPA